MDWKPYAERLACEIADPVSRRRPLIARTTRTEGSDWVLHDGPADPEKWLSTAYSDRTLVTRIGPLHADHAEEEQGANGRATSSSTHPRLVVQMYRHGRLVKGLDLLDVGTGSGYGTALAAQLLGDKHVTARTVRGQGRQPNSSTRLSSIRAGLAASGTSLSGSGTGRMPRAACPYTAVTPGLPREASSTSHEADGRL